MPEVAAFSGLVGLNVMWERSRDANRLGMQYFLRRFLRDLRNNTPMSVVRSENIFYLCRVAQAADILMKVFRFYPWKKSGKFRNRRITTALIICFGMCYPTLCGRFSIYPILNRCGVLCYVYFGWAFQSLFQINERLHTFCFHTNPPYQESDGNKNSWCYEYV